MVGHSNAGASDLDRTSSSLDKAQIGYPSARRLPTPRKQAWEGGKKAVMALKRRNGLKSHPMV